jgi:type I restriction enzyme R subunit
MFNTPESIARQEIDRLLESAGWIIQNQDTLALGAGRGIAVREFRLTTGPADYLLFVDRKVVGVIEAKKAGETLSGYEIQAQRYSAGLLPQLQAPIKPLPFLYQSTSNEIQFTNGLDPIPRSRLVFAFHRPEMLAEWIGEGKETLRWRLGNRYEPLIPDKLWQAQIEAISNLEASLGQGRERALIQMATGSGKTFTAVNYIYRMLRQAKAKRVLFLVDRNNLSKQTLTEFQNFNTPDDGRKFTEIYNVQRLTSNTLDDSCKVVITTIQRLYSMLRGEAEFDPALEEESLFDQPIPANARPKEVAYNPRIPIEYFDVIVTDECHRSIYNLWRQVLEYFDAFLIGMTATPSKATFGFFRENLVMEYNRQRAELDGVNVGGQVYVIRTQITAEGSTIPTGFHVPRRDRKTRERRMEMLDEEFVYSGTQLDQAVVTPSQIRMVIRTFRERLFTEIFPDRRIVPKTLVFAKDDSHAEDIVRIVREEFNQGNDFCQKITYKVDGKPDDLIKKFRNEYDPRIAVTVDMIATGTDIKPLEILLFMRMVRSSQLFEQMQGRGVRVITPADLQVVTEDATSKDRFVIVDAVGVVDVPKLEMPTLEREPNVPFAKLLDNLAAGDESDDTFITLAKRISRLQRRLTERDQEAIEQASGGYSLTEIAHLLLDATELDLHIKAAQATTADENPPQEAVSRAEEQLKQQAADLLNPTVRKLLKEIQGRDSIIIDEISIDTLQQAGFQDGEKAAKVVQTFREFIDQNKDEITALRILYNIPYKNQRLEWVHIKELAERLQQPPVSLTAEKVWAAYARIEPERVRMGQTKRLLTDLVALVRHGAGLEAELVPFPEQVRARYQNWLQVQSEAGTAFNPEQKVWLDAIAEHIGVNLTIDLNDFNDGLFFERGGIRAAISSFGDMNRLKGLLDDLNTVLAA